MENIDEFKAIIITAFGALTGLWGWLGWLIVGWIVCMLLDWVTGNMAAARNGTWSSKVARDGIWHKLGMACIVVIAGGIDLLLSIVTDILPVSLPFQYPGLVCPVVLVWYIVTEMGSIAENAVSMGAAVPQWLLRILAITKNTVENTVDGVVDDDDSETTGGPGA